LQPDIVSVAFDPEGTGPDTHYKVLQVVAAGLRHSIARGRMHNMTQNDGLVRLNHFLSVGDLGGANPVVWGYRNVWFVFAPSDATIFIPGILCVME